MPLGPRVLLTRSAIAIAPTKEDMRALEPWRDGGREGGRDNKYVWGNQANQALRSRWLANR